MIRKTTKRLLCYCLFTSAFCGLIHAQYQLPNPGFEEWEQHTIKDVPKFMGAGSNTATEPVGWNSFGTAKASNFITAFAINNNQLEESSEAKSGSYSAVIKSIETAGIIANGNLTTGRISAANMKPIDLSNHNYTIVDDPMFSASFTGLPDSLKVWIKYIPAKEEPQEGENMARISALLHNDVSVKDPGADKSHVLAVAELDYESSKEEDEYVWQLLSIPFSYDDEEFSSVEKPSFALITFTTNKTPGEGSAGDLVYIDDVEMIYNSRLNDLQYNDVSIEGFNKEIMDYEVVGDYEEGCLTAIADGRGASVSISYDEDTAVATISVKGDNFSEDSDNYHEYKVSFLQQKYSLTFDIAEGAVITPSIIDAEVKEGEDYTFTVSTPASNIKPYVTIGGEELGKNEGEEWEYTISSITSDLTVKIELVTYHTLVFDVAEGIVLEPLVTIIEVEESESYTFYMTFDENYDNYIPAVTVNGNSVAIVEGDDVWSYTLSGIVENYDIVIGKQEVSGVQVNNLKLLIRGGKGILEVDTDEVLNIAVFNVTGQIVVQRTINGYDNIPLGRGIYIVRAGEKVYKVAIE